MVALWLAEPCWEWAGYRGANGYGYYDRRRLAHRVMYERWAGPIPEGLQIDHLCQVRHCVNPLHLEAVTPQENTRRSTAAETRRRLAAAQTHCKRGHPLSGDNVWIVRVNGGAYSARQCKACNRIAGAKYRQKLKERSV